VVLSNVTALVERGFNTNSEVRRTTKSPVPLYQDFGNFVLEGGGARSFRQCLAKTNKYCTFGHSRRCRQPHLIHFRRGLQNAAGGERGSSQGFGRQEVPPNGSEVEINRP
jgi:hypothetical protein